ncbi:MAG TPA: FHA domain-containing protein [Phototrophicaceae bacterium]|jgi:pSer/pThr/pTyr-binding forkhead associated (FHA) protein|nr:FHA domain-containing protein [Phototrophicaceae bacterium]
MSEQPKKKETDFLNLPPGTEMAERAGGNVEFAETSRLQLKIDNQKLTVMVKDQVYVGRSVEGDERSWVDIDLSPQGAYQSGVSRRHAIIRRREGVLYVEDLRSTNGTRINGSQLAPDREYRLRDGDEVEFGRVRAILRFLPPTE